MNSTLTHLAVGPASIDYPYTLDDAHHEIQNLSARFEEDTRDARDDITNIDFRLRNCEHNIKVVNDDLKQQIHRTSEFLFARLKGPRYPQKVKYLNVYLPKFILILLTEKHFKTK